MCVHGNRIIGGCKGCAILYRIRRSNNKPNFLWEAAKNRAKKRKIPFTITVDDIIIPATCPIFGIEIDWRNRDHAASIDEVVQGLGYVPGNFCVVSGRANRIKSDASLQELQALVSYIKIRKSPQFGKWPD